MWTVTKLATTTITVSMENQIDVIAQVGTSRVLVQHVDGGSPTLISTDLQLAGVDVTAGALLLHDGHRAEVHTFDESCGSMQLTARFEVHGGAMQALDTAEHKLEAGQTGRGAAVSASTVGASMALHEQCVYRTAPGCVEVCNWAGELASAQKSPTTCSQMDN